MKKYQILETPKDIAQGDCDQPHIVKEFDGITEAVEYLTKYKGTSKLCILKLVTWKTVITDITETPTQ